MKWRIGRLWAGRRLPRWRRVRLGDAGAEAAWSLPIPDGGSPEDLAAGVVILVGAVVFAVVLIPLLLFGIELIILGLLVAAGILGRALLARPWVVRAIPASGHDAALGWKVTGLRRSGRVIDEVARRSPAGFRRRRPKRPRRCGSTSHRPPRRARRPPTARDGRPWLGQALNRSALVADVDLMAGADAADEVIELVYPAAERIRAVCGVVVMWSVGVAWAVFMLNVGLDRPQTPSGGRPVAVALVALSAPFFVWGYGYWRRVFASTPTIALRHGSLVIDYEPLLRAPIVLRRSMLAGVAIDDAGTRVASDELRFALVTDLLAAPEAAPSGRWLYSRYSGSPVPVLGTRERTPNVALLFTQPTYIEAARLGRRRPLQVNGGERALYRHEAARGLLLDVSDSDRLRELIGPWGILRNVAEGDLLDRAVPDTYPSLSGRAADDAKTQPVPVGVLKRRSPARAGWSFLWLLAIAANARSSSTAGIALVVGLGLGMITSYLVRRGGALSPLWRACARIPLAARAFLIYPAVSALAFGVAILVFQPRANQALAYLLLPLLATGFLVLVDASAQRVSSDRRVGWAVTAAIPALVLSGFALRLAA